MLLIESICSCLVKSNEIHRKYIANRLISVHSNRANVLGATKLRSSVRQLD